MDMSAENENSALDSEKASPEEVLVVFTPSGKRGHFPAGTPVLQAARSLGVDIDSVCGGRGICARCQVLLSEGDFAKHGISSKSEHLSEQTETEKQLRTEGILSDNRRLGCNVRLLGNAVIDVPPDSQVHRQVVRKQAEVRDIEMNPLVRLYFVEIQEPDMHDPASDLLRLMDALEFEWRLLDLQCDLQVIQQLQQALRHGHWEVTVAVYEEQRIIAVWPGFKDKIYGIAVDVGSTTIAAHLSDLTTGEVVASAGIMNPQIRFGEDLMSRVSYLMMNPGGEHEMTDAVRGALNELFTEVAAEADIGKSDILDLTFVGNPVMHHLLLGISPIELGGAPFALASDNAICLLAKEMGIEVHAGARAYILPCVAGHVGADTAGVMLSEGAHNLDELTLMVDVGTNAEIVLGNKNRLLACSSPTGPAFEGAQISGGQRAAPGAIERVRIDSETLEPRIRVIGCDLWSDDAGFEAHTEKQGITGICGSGIIEVLAEMYLAGILDQDGVVDGSMAAKSPRVFAEGRTFSYLLHDGEPRIVITQNDVRAIQLAKAALYAGIKLLMDRLHIQNVDRIRLAGAFGSHIDVKYAMVLGLIPDCELKNVTSAGNAAGTGARIALLDRNSRHEIEALVRRVEKIETAVEPKFQQHFVEAMAIPHKTEKFVELAKAVKLPIIKKSNLSTDSSSDSGRNRRRRRR